MPKVTTICRNMSDQLKDIDNGKKGRGEDREEALEEGCEENGDGEKFNDCEIRSSNSPSPHVSSRTRRLLPCHLRRRP